ncbi:hypothetical protein AK830_g1190 [Neonectria ditissima]|uniref:Cut9-interacting protein scn1 n=1 Tax=Neonectria ditissima TaxID=78410 RepID=A0A0P7BJK9_9HYPO|nr:hypothetical protein AK830_g1190 [Neonectria ditissima]
MCVQGQEQNTAPAPPRRYDDAFPWHIGVFDAHNHVAERMHSVSDLAHMKARSIAVMATRTQDQSFVADLAAAHGAKGPGCFSRDATTVVAGYGRHPWFCHELYDDTSEDPTYVSSEDVEAAKGRHYKAVLTPSPEDPAFWHDLPTPMPLSTFIAETRTRLRADPTAMVGEVGLDKPFRLPMQWQPEAKAVRDPARTPGGRERRPLSPHNIQMSHQKTVLMAHLRLAGELGRAVSVHGVQVHGVLYDFLTSSWKGYELKGKRAQEKERKSQTEDNKDDEKEAKPYPPRICLHSFSGKSDAVKQYLRPSIPAQIYFSFSKTNNLSSGAARVKTEDAVKLVPDNRVLVESDLHTAGDRMDSELEEMYRTICEIKGWDLEDGVSRIASNYREFVFGI